MHECGITDNGNRFSVALAFVSLVKAVNSGNGSTHANGCVNCGKRRNSTESITADIAENGEFILFKSIEKSVRTSCTHNRRSCRNVFVKLLSAVGSKTELFGNYILAQLVNTTEQFLSGYFNTDVAAVGFDYAVKLLNNNYLVNGPCKILNFLNGQRIYHTELENGIFIAANLFCVLIACA